MDVKAGKESHAGIKAPGRQRDQRVGQKDRTAPLLMEDGEHKQQKRRNRVKGAGNGTYEVMTRILLHPIHHPTSTIESCGKWIETVRDGKSI